MKSIGVTKLKPINRTMKLVRCIHQPIYDHKTKNTYCKLCGHIFTKRGGAYELEYTEVDETSLEFNDNE